MKPFEPNGEAKIRVTHTWNPPGRVVREATEPARVTKKLVALRGSTRMDRATGRDRSPSYGGLSHYEYHLLAYRIGDGAWVTLTEGDA